MADIIQYVGHNKANGKLHCFGLLHHNQTPSIQLVIYNSSLRTLGMNFLKMFVLTVNSSIFSGAKPPFFNKLSNLANSLEAKLSLLLNLSKTLT
jgi:hypothetical protein